MKKSFAYPYGVWLAVFILAPILMVVVYAFHNADGGFTLHNFSYLPGYLPIFGRSFWLAFLSTVVCLVLGYPMAYLMSRLSASKQSLCMMLIMLPMWINSLVIPTIVWFVLKAGLVTIPHAVMNVNQLPMPICSFLATHGDFRVILLEVVLFAVSWVIWYPFFKAHEMKVLKEEEEA